MNKQLNKLKKALHKSFYPHSDRKEYEALLTQKQQHINVCQENINYLNAILSVAEAGKTDINVNLAVNCQNLAVIDPKASLDVIPTLLTAFHNTKTKLDNEASSIERYLHTKRKR